jgi:hypothetical protein
MSMNDKANEQAEAADISAEDAEIEELAEGDAAAAALGGTGIELIANAVTPLTVAL